MTSKMEVGRVRCFDGGRSSVGRAPDCGSGCRRFKSGRSPHFLIMKHIFYLPIILFLFGCVVIPSKRVTFNDIKVGMPREEAVSLLGKPHRISAKGNEEKLYYNESALYIGIFGVGKVKEANREYRLHLIDGKVDSFGLVGEHGAEVEAEKGD